MNDEHKTSDRIPEMVIEATACASAILAGRTVTPSEVSEMIREIHSTIVALSTPAETKLEPAALTPAVSVRKSVTDEYLICLHDGKKFKTLRKHLASKYGQTPEQYRAAFGLPSDYPMVAAAYSRQRSAMANAIGLGQSRRNASAANGAHPVNA